MLSSVEQAFVGREEIRAPLKTPTWEAKSEGALVNLLLKTNGQKRLCRNYRPLSDLLYVSKLTERSASDQLLGHLSFKGLFFFFFSLSLRTGKYYSIETVLLMVKNDIKINKNKFVSPCWFP